MNITKKHLSILKIDYFFDAIIGSDQVDLPKPFPEIGLKACRLMNIHSEKVIVIGDTDGDMNLGKNLNSIATIGVVTGNLENNHHFTEANYIINHYRSEEHTSELQSRGHLVCRLLLEKKKG